MGYYSMILMSFELTFLRNQKLFLSETVFFKGAFFNLMRVSCLFFCCSFLISTSFSKKKCDFFASKLNNLYSFHKLKKKIQNCPFITHEFCKLIYKIV